MHNGASCRAAAARIRRRRKGQAMPRVTIRIDFGDGRHIGHGKIRLLEMIAQHGSISRAAREMGMSYRRAWLLVDNLNRCFREPLVAAQVGGVKGGGASLTAFGRGVVEHYRAIEEAAAVAGADHVGALTASLAET